MLWLISNCRLLFATVLVSFAVMGSPASAVSEFREIDNEVDTITVMSESSLSLSMSQISSLFTQLRTSPDHSISVSNNFGDSGLQKKKIEDGESADIYITSQPELVQELKIKGLVDVYSIGKIAVQGDKTYTVAVVAGEHMTPARVFLDFLKSYEAKELFKKNGFTTP
jgi:ABC-type molybdate transport system substrate-binding protein